MTARGAFGKPKPSAAQYQYKVTICHNTGSATNPTVTISVSPSAVPAHVNWHGDTLGDASAAMLERVPALPEGWTVGTADACRLPFADGAFAVVTAVYLLHVVDAATRRGIIRECRRVLRPGGRLVTVTPALPRTRVARMLYAPLAAVAGSAVGPAAGFRPLDPRAELEEATFTIAATTYVGRGYPSLCVLARR